LSAGDTSFVEVFVLAKRMWLRGSPDPKMPVLFETSILP